MSERTGFDRGSNPSLPLVEIPKQSRQLLFQTFLKLHVSSMGPNRLNVNVISFQALTPQARAEKMPLLSADAAIRQYPVEILPAIW